ncbi:DUF4242 domain-containing protein [Geodermatophilus sp. SYSU D00815]
MPRYLVERTLGDVTREELDAAAERSTAVREARYPHITWEHTHVVSTPDGFKAFCVYESPDPESIRRHAADAGLPVDLVHEVETDLVP